MLILETQCLDDGTPLDLTDLRGTDSGTAHSSLEILAGDVRRNLLERDQIHAARNVVR